MDQVKIGGFLRELRKEKNLTQEQLGEVLNVSARTVSRWETGSNMPDISILVEIADFYQLDVREILDGEKKTGLTNDGSDIKEVAEYADRDKERLAIRTRIYSVIGLLGLILNSVIKAFGYSDTIPGGLIAGSAMILVYAALATCLIYTSGRLQILQRRIRTKIKKNIVLIVITIVVGIILLFTLGPMLLIGAAG